MDKKNIPNSEKCPRFGSCSVNVCPLDPEAKLKTNLPGEEICPYCLKKKARHQKGIKTLAPDSVLLVVPESNVGMLNRRNQKRWSEIHIALRNNRLFQNES